MATERFLVSAAQHLVKRYGVRSLVYGGGVALNCRANQVLAQSGIVNLLHVGPATHDAGTALGAAWHVHTLTTRRPVPPQDPVLTMFSGPPLGEDEPSPDDVADIGHLDAIVDLLLQGHPIGWLDGRTEFGPRALGARSILASPLHADAVTRINQLKGRHEFEPLALAIPEEDAPDIFLIPQSARALAPLMLTTAYPTPHHRTALTHVLHQDGTTRVQVVKHTLTPRLHDLLRHFGQRSGLPLLVNTSFNPRGDPMPATLAQALPLAERLGLTHLVVNGRLWKKPWTQPSTHQSPSLSPSAAPAASRCSLSRFLSYRSPPADRPLRRDSAPATPEKPLGS